MSPSFHLCRLFTISKCQCFWPPSLLLWGDVVYGWPLTLFTKLLKRVSLQYSKAFVTPILVTGFEMDLFQFSNGVKFWLNRNGVYKCLFKSLTLTFFGGFCLRVRKVYTWKKFKIVTPILIMGFVMGLFPFRKRAKLVIEMGFEMLLDSK